MVIPLLPLVARRLEGKVAIITGGASGIGEYTAKLFTQHGAKVVIVDIQDDLGQSFCKELGQSAQYLHCDVTNEAHVQNVVDYTMSQYGKLDIMYNNAGTVDSLDPNIINKTLSDFENVHRVNLIGPFLGTKHAARVMIPAQQGSIITTASTCAIVAGMGPHGYSSSKCGVVGLMKNTAVEFGKYGIRVNCISPHLVTTPLALSTISNLEDESFSYPSNLRGKRCTLEDVANATLFLASDESKYISGHNLVVDGGFTIMSKGLCMYE